MIDLIWEFNHLPALIAGMDDAAARAADKYLAAVEEDAKNNAPVESGALQASGFRIDAIANDFNQAVANMLSLATKDTQPIEEPEVNTEGGEGVVGFAADYAAFVHDGHHTPSGGMTPANPFLAQAVAAHEGELVDNTKQHIEYLAEFGDILRY